MKMYSNINILNNILGGFPSLPSTITTTTSTSTTSTSLPTTGEFVAVPHKNFVII